MVSFLGCRGGGEGGKTWFSSGRSVSQIISLERQVTTQPVTSTHSFACSGPFFLAMVEDAANLFSAFRNYFAICIGTITVHYAFTIHISIWGKICTIRLKAYIVQHSYEQWSTPTEEAHEKNLRATTLSLWCTVPMNTKTYFLYYYRIGCGSANIAHALNE